MDTSRRAGTGADPLLLHLVLVNLFGHVALSGGRVTTSLHALRSGASESWVGVLVGVYGLLPMLGAISMGRWVDRVGPYVPMRTGIVAVLAGVSLPVFLPGVPALLLTAALCGVGFGMVSVAAQYSVGHLRGASAADRVANFGWLALGHSASGIAGPVAVGFAMDGLGDRAAFGLLAICSAVAAALVLRQAPRLSALGSRRDGASDGDPWQLLAEPRMRRIYLVGMLLAMAWDLFTFLMPILGHRQRLSAATIGTILAVFAAGTFGARLSMPRIARRLTEWQILRVAVVTIVAVYVLLPLAHAVPLFLALSFLLGAAVGCTQPNMLSLLHAVAPAGRAAEAVGLRASLGSASTVFVPFLFGATAASIGVAPVFWGVAILIAATLPAVRGADR